MNNSLRQEFGLNENETRPLRVQEMLSQESNSFFDEYMKRIIQNDKDEGLFQLKSQSRKTVIIEYKNSLVRDMDGNPIGVLGSGRDITSF